MLLSLTTVTYEACAARSARPSPARGNVRFSVIKAEMFSFCNEGGSSNRKQATEIPPVGIAIFCLLFIGLKKVRRQRDATRRFWL